MTLLPELKRIEEEIFTLRNELIFSIAELNRCLGSGSGIQSSQYLEVKARYFDLKNRIANLKSRKEDLMSQSASIKETLESTMLSSHLSAPGERVTVAVVEDDADDREFICTAIKETGVQVEVVPYRTGTDFLKALHNGDTMPNVVLTDIRMPITSGFDVIRGVKEDERFNKIPVFVISTSGNPDDVELATVLGAAAYYVKPYSMQDYTEITGKILNTLSGYLSFEATITDSFSKLAEWFRRLGQAPAPALGAAM